MRPIWSGSISFGLVNIPVDLVSALTHKKIKFHFLHKKCGTRIEYQKHCPACNLDLSWADVEHAYEYEKGKYVALTSLDFKKVDIKLSRMIEITSFVEQEDVNPIYFSHPYYLLPQGNGVKAYFLLHEAMVKTKKVAVAKLLMKDREHLVLIKPENDVLLLEVLYFAEEIIDPKTLGLPRRPELRREELDLAKGLISGLSKKFDAKKFKDEYQEKLMAIIEKKVKGEKIVVKMPTIAPTKVEELMNALKESMKALKK